MGKSTPVLLVTGAPGVGKTTLVKEMGEQLFHAGVAHAVVDIDETLDRLVEHGAQLVSNEVVQCEDAYRLCYVRGPEGILIGLAQELG